MSKNNKFIEFQNVSLKYQNTNQTILQNLNFSIDEGEMIAIIGHSGVGKSTLFKAFVKAVQITEGDIFINGNSFNSFSKKQLKSFIKSIGFLTQKANLINTDTVFNNVKKSAVDFKNPFMAFFSLLSRKQKVEIFSTLDKLDILDKAFYRVSDLSGGQQQRVEIAKLLIQHAKLLLADEPTSSLDNATSNEVLTMLKEINQKNKTTILVNIHDLSMVKKYFTKLIVLQKGKLVLWDSTTNISLSEMKQLVNKTT
ncbi:phosphonate ABC transporter ATP-binding protein [Mycoplasma sp. 3341]|uniref:phosphonate ABC transporter ATP-binding protein n=1 Tax=Mycoplasma sp. 3341 TaxID=3447506 RepID=UPI003F65EDF9